MWGSSLVRAGIWRWLELSGGAHLPEVVIAQYQMLIKS